MKRASVLLMTIIMIFLCAAVAWQWIVFSDESGQSLNLPPEKINQDIIVKAEKTGLNVKQVFSNLEQGKSYGIHIPGQVENLTCLDSKGAPCKNDFEHQSFQAKDTRLELEYFVTVDSSAVEFLFNDWLVSLVEGAVYNTRIELVDKFQRKGSWVAGIPLKGYKQMDLVNYYVFEGKGKTPSLYWQNTSLEKLSGQKGINYYAHPQDQLPIYEFDSLINVSEKNHLSVIFNNDNRSVHGNGLVLVSKSLSRSEMEQQLATAFISMKLPELNKDEEWLLEALASLMTKETSMNPKAYAIVQELTGKLTPAELNEFTKILSHDNSSLNHRKLDEHLTSIRGKGTNFFTLNKLEASAFYRLLFNDDRRIMINGENIDDIDIAIDGERRLFPFVKTMEAMGFQIETDPGMQWIKVSSIGNEYLFNLKNNTFVLNEENFGLLENPFELINSTVYIEQRWLNGVFKILIEENNQEIVLSVK